MTTTKLENPALPLDFNIEGGVSSLKGRDGEDYLQFTSHMTTFYKQTYGEHSRFFFALRDARLIGAKCTECGQVLVPAASWHCPECNFADMEEVELGDRGVLAHTAPITIFPSASFVGDAPFCRGYVDVARDAEVASFLPARLRTTTGLERPGIFVKGVELKMVFEDERVGSIRDMYWVPVSELSQELVDKTPLFTSDLDFTTPPMPDVETDDALVAALDEALATMTQMASKIERSKRAQADIAGRTHAVAILTGGGPFGLYVSNSGIRVAKGLPDEPEFTMVAQDPGIFTRWVADGSLTDAAVEGTLWLPHKKSFQLLPILDRLPRSIRRDVRD